MSLSVLFGKGKAGTIGELQLDATLEETHEYDQEISAYPVEDGSTLNDNIRKLPERLSITGYVTNSPINTLQANKAEIVENVDGTVTVKNLKRTEVNNNVEYAQDTLMRICGRSIDGEDTEPELVKVVTGLRVYSGMAISSLRFPRNSTTGQALRFEANLINVMKVKNETVFIPNPEPAVLDRAQSTRDNGKKTTTTPNEKKQATTSKLKALFNKASAFANG